MAKLEEAVFGDQKTVGLVETTRHNAKSLDKIEDSVESIIETLNNFKIERAKLIGMVVTISFVGTIFGWLIATLKH